jgi:WD40 repeat protein
MSINRFRTVVTRWLAVPVAALLGPVAGLADGLPITAPERTDAVRFQDEILPFLAANCTACHNPKIHEGGLILDSLKGILTGGDSGPGVIAGKAAESPVFLRSAHLQEDFMPPPENKVGAKAMSPVQLGLLERWINEGAAAGPAIAKKPINWRPIPAGSGGVLAVAMSNDGRVTAAARGGRLSLYDSSTGALLGALVDPATADAPAAADSAHRDTILSLAISPNNDSLASASFRTVKLWERSRASRLAEVADTSGITAMAAAAGSAACGRPDGTVILIDASSGAVRRAFKAHTAAVAALTLSADGATVYSAGADGSIVATNAADGNVTGRFMRPAGIRAVAVTGGGTQLAVAEADGVVRIFALPLPAPPIDPVAAALKPIKELNAGAGPVVALADTPTLSGHLLAGGADGTVRLWNIEGAAVVRQFAHGGALGGMALKPDGTRLTTVGTVPGVKLWNVADGAMVAEWKGDVRIAEKLRLAEVDSAVRKQDVEYGKAQVTAAEKAIEAANTEMTQSNEKLAAADKTLGEKAEVAKTALLAADEAATLAQTAGTALAQSTTAHEAATKAAAAVVAAMEGTIAGRDAFALVAASSAGDAAAAEALKSFEAAAAAAAAARAAADQAVVQAAQQIERAKAKADEATKKMEEMKKASTAAEDARKGAETASTSAKRAVEFAQAQVARSNDDLPKRKEEATKSETDAAASEAARQALADQKTASEKPAAAVAFSPDGHWILCAGADGVCSLHGGQDAIPRDTWDGGAGESKALVAFLDNGRALIGGGAVAAGIWQVAPRWTLARTIGGELTPPASDDEAGVPPIDGVTALAFSPDGKILATGSGRASRSGEIKLWNVADGALVREFAAPHSDAVTALEFSRDGQFLASGATDRFVKVHSVADGKHIKSFEGHTGHVLGVAWQANGRRLSSAGADNAIKVWDVVTGEQQRTIAGLKKEVTAVKFIAPGEEVIACSGDPTVRIYNAASGGTVREFPGAADFVQAVAAGPTWLAAGCQDGKLRIWTVADGKLAHTLEPSPAPAKP